jgi:5'-nucleotidase
VVDALLDEGITKAIIIGGTGAVGSEVVTELEDAGITVAGRLAGEDRSETAAQVARYAVANHGFSTTAVNVASGDPALDGADALSAGPLSGQQQTPLLVTRDKDTPGVGLLSYLFEHSTTLSQGHIIGGPGAVTGTARDEMRRIARGAADYTMTLLHVNDLESQLIGIDAPAAGEVPEGEPEYDTDLDNDGRKDYGGVDRHETVIEQLRAGSAGAGGAAKHGVVTVSAGDNFLAGPELSASLNDDGTASDPIYDALAMELTGYDASTIGNHEFDFGPDFFAEFVQEVVDAEDGSFPFMSSNLDFSEVAALQALVESEDIVKTHVVEKAGEQIGLIGLTTPELPAVSSPGDVTVIDRALAAITQEQVDALTADGVDKIVLVSHLQDIDNERALAGELSGVDVIVGGGGGELVANNDDALIPGDDRAINPDTGAPYRYPIVEKDADGDWLPIVTTPGEYAYVGKLVVSFDTAGEVIPGSWVPESGPVRVSGVDDQVADDAVAPDAAINTRVVQPVQDHLEALEANVVASTEVGLNGVREEVRTRITNLGALMADALLETGQNQAAEFDVEEPQIAIQNGGGIRNDSIIPAGDITELDTYSIAPFPNFVAVMPDVSCETVKALLERGVSAAPEAAGQFIQIAGMSFTYDVSEQAQVVDDTTGEILTPGSRIETATLDSGQQVVVNGEVVASCAPITIATNDFSARGGDNYPLGGLDFTNVGKTYQQALLDYLTVTLGGTVTSAQYSEAAVADRIQTVS